MQSIPVSTAVLASGLGAFFLGYYVRGYIIAEKADSEPQEESLEEESSEEDFDDDEESGSDNEEYKMVRSQFLSFALIVRSLLYVNSEKLLIVRMDLKMQRGKIAAQCGHATLGAYRKAVQEKRKKELRGWLHAGQAKIAVQCPNQEELYAKEF